jgi:hypothetical protein
MAEKVASFAENVVDEIQQIENWNRSDPRNRCVTDERTITMILLITRRDIYPHITRGVSRKHGRISEPGLWILH